MATSAIKLVNRVVCPNCWERFAPEEILWQSEHAELVGDPILPDQQLRFLPSRFTPNGNAIDSKGVPCRHLACPKCHLTIARGLLELDPLFLSILGGPGSGKSYLLATAMWKLRELLPHTFGVSFQDADPAANAMLNEWEERLFLNPRPDQLFHTLDLVDKTVLEGHIYNSVSFGQHAVQYARPYLFTLKPQCQHPRANTPENVARILCLYDNAGEHFQPGQDTARNPVTRH